MFPMQTKYHGRSLCFSSFIGQYMPSSIGPLWVLGDTFMSAYHTIFNAATGEERVGFAHSAT